MSFGDRFINIFYKKPDYQGAAKIKIPTAPRGGVPEIQQILYFCTEGLVLLVFLMLRTPLNLTTNLQTQPPQAVGVFSTNKKSAGDVTFVPKCKICRLSNTRTH